jgi:SAM-dependent methyltransferase
MEDNWPVRLFNKSVLKQKKYNEMINALGPTEGKHILEVGSDNGVFSFLFRQRGGEWKSAELDERSIKAIKELVGTDVYRIADGKPLPFIDDEFDCVLIVDIIEHLHDDQGFIDEVYRVLKPEGLLIVNAPTVKSDSLLTKLRNLAGLTDDVHGHVRPGYTFNDLQRLLDDRFTLETYRTHTKFFSKFTDTAMVVVISLLKRGKKEKTSGRGILVTGTDLKSYESMFRVYSIIYPFVRLISRLDILLYFWSGYMLIATAQSNKQTKRSSDGALSVEMEQMSSEVSI